jgi:outer membrane protein assembly factor BamB
MVRTRRLTAVVLLGLTLTACAAPAKRPLMDPFPLRFPLVEVGTLEIDGHVTGTPWARDGIVYFETREGASTAVVASSRAILRRTPAGPAVADPAGSAGRPVLVREGDLLRALDDRGQPLWEFRAGGAIAADPVLSGSRLYFGDEARMFYSLGAGKGKVRWRRRLQGAPVHPAVVGSRTVVVAASNSVVYVLSRKGGSILSWEAVPSRVVYAPVAAGPLVLISSASPTLAALDLGTGKLAGRYEAAGPLVSGALWSPPYVVLFVEDEDSGRQKIVFLRSR